MPSLFAILVPLALLLPIGVFGAPGASPRPEIAREGPVNDAANEGGASGTLPDFARISPPADDQIANQVRIEQRVILRISPRPSRARRDLMAELPQTPLRPRLVERRMSKCIKVAGIAGVQAERGNRLVLFMRDRRIVAADLEKSCTARDFYSGFYLEPSEDGQLCVDRDRLQSRAGAKCQVSRMRQIVAVGE